MNIGLNYFALIIITTSCHQWNNDFLIYFLIWKCKAKPRSIEHVTQKSTTKINKYGEKETPCPTNLKNKDETQFIQVLNWNPKPLQQKIKIVVYLVKSLKKNKANF